MKTNDFFKIALISLILTSCGSVKEGTQVSGISMFEALSDNGTSIIDIPYKWYSGKAFSNDEQTAIEFAQREAYSTISRTITNIVKDKASKGGLQNEGKVLKALNTYWEQISISIQKGAEPIGKIISDYDKKNKLYYKTAKVGIRGDKYNSFIKDAANFKPDDLNQEELNDFIKVNKTIINAAKGK